MTPREAGRAWADHEWGPTYIRAPHHRSPRAFLYGADRHAHDAGLHRLDIPAICAAAVERWEELRMEREMGK